jgi:hypothetical protein
MPQLTFPVTTAGLALPVWVGLARSSVLTTSTHTAAGRIWVNLYEVGLAINDPSLSASSWLAEPYLLVMELSTVLPDADVIVGLDVLLNLNLHLDGPGRKFTLYF